MPMLKKSTGINILLRLKLLIQPRREVVDQYTSHKTGNGIHKIMCLYIYRCTAKQHIYGEHHRKEPFLRPVCQHYKYCSDTYVRTGECCCGAFTGTLRHTHKLCEQATLALLRNGNLGMQVEIIAKLGVGTCNSYLLTYHRKIELWAGNRQEYIYNIIEMP